MRTNACACSFRGLLSQFLTPEDWRQAHAAWRPKQAPSRWGLQALAWVALAMALGTGDSQEERFVTARAVYVACHQRCRRPGATLQGFLKALARLPVPRCGPWPGPCAGTSCGSSSRPCGSGAARAARAGCPWPETAPAWSARAARSCSGGWGRRATPTRPPRST